MGEQFQVAAPPSVTIEKPSSGRSHLFLAFFGIFMLACGAIATGMWFVRHQPPPAPPPVGAKVWEVGPGQGTIAEAMTQANAGDRIVVRAGEYREQVVLKSGVTIVSNPPRAAVLRAAPGTTGP